MSDKDPRAQSARAGGIDDTSRAIIDQLCQDGRRSYAAIGKAVGLSEAAVRQRVQRLIDTGVMRVVAVTDPLKLGYARQAMIGIQVEGPVEPVAEALVSMENIEYVVTTAGGFDILAELVCEDDDHLVGVLTDRIRSLEGVHTTQTFMYLDVLKQTCTWGTALT